MAQAAPASETTPEHISIIRDRYLIEAHGDPVLALDRALGDALADLCEAERRSRQRDRLISRGYVRGALSDETYDGMAAAE